jgi:hypothetical protein
VCAGSTTPSVVIVSLLLFDKPWFLKLRENLLLHSSYLPLGVPNGLVIHHAQGQSGRHQRHQLLVNLASSAIFLAPLPGKREDFCEGSSSHTHSLLCYLFCFTLFYFTCIAFYIKNPKKLESLVAVFTCLLSFC